MSSRRRDAVVVGGGLAGLAAAVALGRAGLKTLHLAPKGPPDSRTSALMNPSVDLLREFGLIDAPEALGQALTQIRIIDATGRLIRAPETLFDSHEAGLDAFGWNFPNLTLTAAFEEAGAKLTKLETRAETLTSIAVSNGHSVLTLSDGSTIETALVVGADGKKSTVRAAAGIGVREHAFQQAALVCDLTLGRPLGGTSVEFHYDQGPFTLVPAGENLANLVWIDDVNVLEAAKASGEKHLVAQLEGRSMHLFGGIALRGPANVFPLSTLSVDRAGANGVVLVGEAAHAFPPIGAQGLNLGLRDVADLAASLTNVDTDAPDWATAVSDAYAHRRAGDLARTGAMVDALFRSLLAEMLPAQALRAGGLWALKLLPPLRRQAFSLGMGAR
jgi:2-octaprenyl-6-methoxyphenol hydroxylase